MKKIPGRRMTDQLRQVADRLWEKGDRQGSTEMHSFARKKEAERAILWVFDMDARNTWGNRISWNDWEKRTVDGHTTPVPRVGDELRSRMESGKIARFRVVQVKRWGDPKDMFFATVEDIGYVEDGAPPVTRFVAYGEVLS